MKSNGVSTWEGDTWLLPTSLLMWAFSLIGIVRTGAGIHTEKGDVAFGFELLPGIGLKLSDSSFIHLNVGIGSYDSETMGTFQIGYSYSF